MNASKKIVLLGAGAWGGCIGKLAESSGNAVSIKEFHEHGSLGDSIDGVLIGIPSQFVRKTLAQFQDPGVPVLSLSKGLEIGTDQRVSQIIQDVWPHSIPAALSGPTFASEIAKGLPATAVVASESSVAAAFFQSLLHCKTFRLYTSTDIAGVELGGALKNIYAVAGGVCRGLNLGDSATAGLITRSLAEMTRIGIRKGGRVETFSGLSGVGDLMMTATSPLSRNFRVGMKLAQGEKLEDILKSLGGVAEGVTTAKALYLDQAVPEESKPIATQVYRLLHDGLTPAQAVQNLLERAPTVENLMFGGRYGVQ